MNMTIRLSILLVLGLLLPACASVFPKEVRNAAIDVPFRELRQNTEKYQGKTVILGGYILETSNMADQSVILILQAPLNPGYEPKERDLSQGRFMAVQEEFMDPEVYEDGRAITVAGEVVGKESIAIGDFKYPMVKVAARHIRLWAEPESRWGTYYYDPFYYDPFYPWHDPFYRYRMGYPYYR